MRKCVLWILINMLVGNAAHGQKRFTLEDVLRAPFPQNLTAAKKMNRMAWTFDQEGKRNIWVAEGTAFSARRITPYLEDDGQEISDMVFSNDARTIIYVRGGDTNQAGQYPNPTSNPTGVEQSIWSVAWSGGKLKKIDVGHSPKISARGMLAYIRNDQIWIASLDETKKPERLVVRGQNYPQEWSPDGSRLVFVSKRGDHSFIGVYDVEAKSIRFIAPTVDRDSDPGWSVDGKHIAFVRQPAQPNNAPHGYFIEPDRPHPWAVWTADAEGGNAYEIWHSTAMLQGSYPYAANDNSGGVMQWAAGNRLVIVSEEDGWQHLYALSADGRSLQLLTPGNCEVRQWSLSSDRESALLSSNCGDLDRQHLWKVPVAGGPPIPLTPGEGIESGPIALGDGKSFAYFGADATHATRPFVGFFASGQPARVLASETWPKDFPADQLVAPQQVTFASVDGLNIHAQLFLPRGRKPNEKRPAVIFSHGGPRIQTLLGWHYRRYFWDAYAMNEYLVSRGYVVLSVNYRSGVGYGRAFREIPGRAGRGAAEYQDVLAAGKYLQSRSEVNPARVGLWGGSYGGFLTAMGLARNSDIFVAGVDFHGVHAWQSENWKNISPELLELAHESSPVASVNTWKSPVLFIHGDDDRNVYFAQTVDLVARLRERGVIVEQLVFPDEIHVFLLYRNWLSSYHATSDFLDRFLLNP